MKSEFEGLEQLDVYVEKALNPNCDYNETAIVYDYPGLDTSYVKSIIVDMSGYDNAIALLHRGTKDKIIIHRLYPDKIYDIDTLSLDLSHMNHGFLMYIDVWVSGTPVRHRAISGMLYLKLHKTLVLEADWCDVVFEDAKTGVLYPGYGGIKIQL